MQFQYIILIIKKMKLQFTDIPIISIETIMRQYHTRQFMICSEKDYKIQIQIYQVFVYKISKEFLMNSLLGIKQDMFLKELKLSAQDCNI